MRACLSSATSSGLPDAIRDVKRNEVIITDPRVSGDALFDVMMRVGRRRGVEFRIAPSLFNCLPRKTEIDQIGALPMIRLFREPLSSAARIIKRASDIIISSVALLLLSPFWLVIAAARQARLARPGLLQAGARRDGWSHLSLLQIPHDAR